MAFLGGIFGTNSKKEGRTMESMHGSAITSTAEKDPVCGMDVDPKTAAGKSEYMGKTYYFCAPGCKKSFDANPAKYLQGGAQNTSGHSHGGMSCCG